MYKETPKAIFSVTFGLFGEKLRYQFYLARNKTTEIMEEVFEVSPKNLRENFRVEELFSARNFYCYFPLWKMFSYVNTETR